MNVTTNHLLIGQRTRMGRLASLVGFLLLIAGFVLSIQGIEYIWHSYASLIGALLLLNIGKASAQRFGIRPRVDEALVGALKSLDQKFHLYNFVAGLRCDHLLVTPHGLQVLKSRPHFGRIRVEGDRMRREGGLMRFALFFSEGGLGRPTEELRREIKALRATLEERVGTELAAATPIDGAIVFTHPRAELVLEGEPGEGAFPVVPVAELRPVVRRREGRGRVAPEVLRAISEMAAEGASPKDFEAGRRTRRGRRERPRPVADDSKKGRR